MAFVFYDTETTGTSTFFDQILEFAAIRTDDEFRELDRFHIRCRLLPHVIPSPRALRITQVAPATLIDSTLPSHYEMMTKIHEKLLSWSPANFVGFNSIQFDEDLMRQAFFQTLYPPYLTNTHGNVRSDVMRLAHATSIYAPDAIKVPLNARGRPVFKLHRLSQENGFHDHTAHEALSDVLATLDLARLIRDRAPDVWQAMVRATTKKFVTGYVRRELIFTLSESHFGHIYSWIVTLCGQNPERDIQLAVFDLFFDPKDYLSLTVDDLVRVLSDNPKPIRSLAANKQPIIMPEGAAPSGSKALEIAPAERRRRMELIRANPDFQVRVGQALARRFEGETRPPYVEQRIYEGFPASGDEALMAKFHRVPWAERIEIASRIEDQRIYELAHRLIYFERPDLLPATMATDLRAWVPKRVLAEGDNVPWMTVSKALRDAEALLQDARGSDAKLLGEVKEFLGGVADSFTSR